MNLKQQLTREEGRRYKAYLDTRRIWTIGVGHVDSSICEGVIWNDAMIDETFDRDVAEKTGEVVAALPWFESLPGDASDDGTANARQAVLLQMAFQMGTEGLLKFHNTLRAIEDGRWADAQAGMLQSAWAKETPERVGRLAEQMLTGEWIG